MLPVLGLGVSILILGGWIGALIYFGLKARRLDREYRERRFELPED